MITIYHNNRCSKSRKTLTLIQSQTSKIKIIEYTKQPIKIEDLKSIIKKLNIKPIQLIRKNEMIWKKLYKRKQMKDKEIIATMIKHPNLIERPIIINNNKAIIGRPPENVLSLFN